MPVPKFATWMLEQEARALLTRLARVQPFMLQESMLPAASLLPASQVAIEEFLTHGRRHVRTLIEHFLDWLQSPAAQKTDAERAQHEFAILRLRFNAIVTHFDLFENVITQRSEHETGVWLSGLDVVSADALRLRGQYYNSPPVICYLDRGIGAAVRRARTRLPGGAKTPVAIIKVPRERMIGTGIASSLIHEVGHQAAALLGLIESVRPVLEGMRESSRSDAVAWELWQRWISEILADLWSVGRVGISSTTGLMGVVSLPRAFVFRLNTTDPHPMPWIRVKLSIAMGKALHPQAAWDRLSALWDEYYPLHNVGEEQRKILDSLLRTIPALVALLLNHRPKSLRGSTIPEAIDTHEVRPAKLRAMLQLWRRKPESMYRIRPVVVFAAVGQARADGKITPEEESVVLGKLLTHWALSSTLQAAQGCIVKSSNRLCCHTCIGQNKQLSEGRNYL